MAKLGISKENTEIGIGILSVLSLMGVCEMRSEEQD